MKNLFFNFRTDFDHYLGSPLAPLELVQYGDFQSAHCADAYPVIKWLLEYFGDLLKFVYRHYPMPTCHPLALKAAVAAEAAALQGKFWHMHDMIFENQQKLNRSSFIEFASEIDLDTRAFEDSLEDRKIFQKVISDFEGGVRSGVDSTPTFFINGVRYDGFGDFENLYHALQNITHFESSATGRSIEKFR
ncbi:MAG TPA: thioredoxin domain-containing protein [Puia sp.]|nr:thioredoxin domain-containing protein [Puia sp.]